MTKNEWGSETLDPALDTLLTEAANALNEIQSGSPKEGVSLTSLSFAVEQLREALPQQSRCADLWWYNSEEENLSWEKDIKSRFDEPTEPWTDAALSTFIKFLALDLDQSRVSFFHNLSSFSDSLSDLSSFSLAWDLERSELGA